MKNVNKIKNYDLLVLIRFLSDTWKWVLGLKIPIILWFITTVVGISERKHISYFLMTTYINQDVCITIEAAILILGLALFVNWCLLPDVFIKNRLNKFMISMYVLKNIMGENHSKLRQRKILTMF